MLFSGVILLAACGGTTAGAVAPLLAPPTTRTYDACSYDAPAREVIRTEADWRRAWARLSACRSPAPDVPAVDFAREMVLLAALGQRATGGHGVRIASAAVSDGVLHVQVIETRPGAGCMTTQALTHPVAVARVPRHDGEVRFADRVEVRDCG